MTEYYHYYRMVHEEHSEKVIEGLHLVFVELPKFTLHSFSEKKMHVLWLRFLTEINEKTTKAPKELLENPEVSKALQVVEESAFDPVQLQNYDDFWDAVRVERTIAISYEKKGREEGREEGILEGGKLKQIEIAKNMKQLGIHTIVIAQASGLPPEEIEKL